MQPRESPPTAEPTPSVRARLGPLLVVLLSLCLHAPSLGWGYFADDHLHVLVLDGELAEEGFRPWALYDFGTLADARHLRDVEGSFAFWTGDAWRASFLRPVSSVARWAEHAAFDGAALPAHAVGLAWWAVFLVLAHRLYLTLGLGRGAATWALLLLAVENGAAMPVGWCANRNSTVEGVLLIAAVLCFVHALRAPPRSTWLLPSAFALAVLATLAKESGVAAFALFAAWCWLGRRVEGAGPDRGRRFEALRTGAALVSLVAAGAYVLAYVALGYGATSLFYPTPWSEPGAWLARVGLLLPGGVVATTTPLITDAALLVPVLIPVTIGLGVLLFVLARRFVGPSARAHGAGPFLFAWALLTVLPQASAPLSDRLFLLPMVGVAGLLGIFVQATRLRMRQGWAQRSERVALRAVLVSGVVLSPLVLLATGLGMVRTAEFTRHAIVTAEVGDPAIGRRDVFILQSPSQLVSLQPTAAQANLTGDELVRHRVLNATRRAVRWTRTGPRSFTLEALDGAFLDSIFERVFLTEELALEPGHTWRLADATIRAVAVEDGLPRVLAVELEHELERASYRFLAWEAAAEGFGRWVHLAPPRIGASIELDEVVPPIPLLP